MRVCTTKKISTGRCLPMEPSSTGPDLDHEFDIF